MALAGSPKSAAEANALERTARAEYEQSNACQEAAARSNRDNNANASGARASIEHLVKEKNAAITELRSGLFCSKCGSTASELERSTGRPFGEHLTSVNGVAVMAAEWRITAKAAQYDAKLSQATKQLVRFRDASLVANEQWFKCNALRANAWARAETAKGEAIYLASREKKDAADAASKELLAALARARADKERIDKERLKAEAERRKKRAAESEADRARLKLAADALRDTTLARQIEAQRQLEQSLDHSIDLLAAETARLLGETWPPLPPPVPEPAPLAQATSQRIAEPPPAPLISDWSAPRSFSTPAISLPPPPPVFAPETISVHPMIGALLRRIQEREQRGRRGGVLGGALDLIDDLELENELANYAGGLGFGAALRNAGGKRYGTAGKLLDLMITTQRIQSVDFSVPSERPREDGQ